jgi:hypothetical protein
MRDLTLLFLLLFTTPAIADTILLKNGRSIKGQLVSMTDERVSILIAGGMIELDRSLVRTVTPQVTPAEAIALKLVKLRQDPSALDRLSLEARTNGLTQQADDIKKLAAGLHLEQRLQRIRKSENVEDYLGLFRWTQLAGYSVTVQKFVVQLALQVDSKNGFAKLALQRLEAAEKSEIKSLEGLKREQAKRVQKRAAVLPKSPLRKQKKSAVKATPKPAEGSADRRQLKKDLGEIRRLRKLLEKERKALEQEEFELLRRRRRRRVPARRILRSNNRKRSAASTSPFKKGCR